jgi:two-component system, OmpR family, phosphate regulon sensor histidine kinase PhoR
MTFNRTYLIIAITSMALIIVLIIQVNWILETAKIKEELFNEKANIVLARTTETLFSDTTIRRKLETGMGNKEVSKIDSLIKFYMLFYDFHIDYYFEVKPGYTTPKNPNRVTIFEQPNQSGCYQKSLDEVAGNNGLELKLVLPDKEQFIIQEMGIPFVTSILLLLVVLVMFWRTTVSLLKEKELSEHTTDFLNNMTHEFKTPLTNIALAGKMMVKDSNIKQEDKLKHYSSIILEENEKLRLQVEQVLSMTALERGEIPLQKTELDVHVLIHDALKCISLQIENKQGDLKLELNATTSVIQGDKTHLTNALCNLIDNAIKYSNEKPELIIQTQNLGEKISIRVSDKGIGIDEKYHEKIFDKFFRVPKGNVHDVKGFGLGLAYIKKIIELHDGTIEVESNCDKNSAEKGTTFILTVPNV